MYKTNQKKHYCIFGILFGVLLAGAIIERTTLPLTSEEMRLQAKQYGVTHGKTIPPKPFVYDGCTFFVDSFITSDLRTACFTHDVAYYYGGTKEERKDADATLQADVSELGILGKALSYPVHAGVRLFGDSLLTKSVDAHWGFGWD